MSLPDCARSSCAKTPSSGGSACTRGLRNGLLGHNQPSNQIPNQAPAAEERNHHADQPDKCGIDLQVLRKAAAHPGDLLVAPGTSQLLAGARGDWGKHRGTAVATEVHLFFV